ncbi:hypothetical protein BR93DRAFT_475518 [Coniochaeta sp. PMI_546]|nr:hypothetical protein BR93DRAFT_475518 [Coniochaeta sp. PMI_546]
MPFRFIPKTQRQCRPTKKQRVEQRNKIVVNNSGSRTRWLNVRQRFSIWYIHARKLIGLVGPYVVCGTCVVGHPAHCAVGIVRDGDNEQP